MMTRDKLARYGIRHSWPVACHPVGVMCSVPVTCANGKYTRVTGLAIDDFSRGKMDATLKELEEERAGVAHLLK